MATVTIPWDVGDGNIILTYTGHGNETVVVTSDDNNLRVERSQVITVRTTYGGSVSRNITVTQAAKIPNFRLSDGKFLKLSDGKYFNVKEEEQ